MGTTENQAKRVLGELVHVARKSRRMSQDELADRAGTSRRTIIDIENSRGNPKFEMLYQLIREMNLPINQLFYPEKAKNSELKDLILEELGRCTDDEMKMVLSVIRSLRERG